MPSITVPAKAHLKIPVFAALVAFGALSAFASPSSAAECPVSHDDLANALKSSVKPSGGPTNGGLDNNEWAAVVNRKGIVCAVAYSGAKPGDQWPGSRPIAAEKANTANAFSLDNFALSTANVYAGAQPAGFLYGITASDPPNPAVLAAGKVEDYGTASDPFIGQKLGGVVVFGGGLGLYNGQGIVGGLGASGDSSCADHNIAWRVRQKLGLDKVPAGVSKNNDDEIIYDIGPSKTSQSGYGHVLCKGSEADIAAKIGSGYEPTWKKQTKSP